VSRIPGIVLAAIALVAAIAFAVARATDAGTPAASGGRVLAVIDGDTIVVALAGDESAHVRLIGIDTPEVAHDGGPSECYAVRATRITRELVLGRQVELRPGRERHDRYGRLLAYVRVEGEVRDVEDVLLERGAARTLAIAPNTDRAAAYAALAAAARRAGRGLWGACPAG
jgi:micrococcal nuclease